VLEGLEGDDFLDGGDGIDTATWESSLCCVRANLSASLATGSLGTDQLEEIENLTGSQGTDVIRGDAGPNALFGGGNTDLLFGGDGDDWLLGGDGDDWLAGEVGSNVLDGGTGANVCADGPGSFCESPQPGDPADTRGPLDVELVAIEGSQNPPTWRIQVRGRMRDIRLWDEGYLVVSLDIEGGEEFDVHAVVRWNRRRPIGLLTRAGARGSSGKVNVRLAGRRGVRVTVPLGQAGLDPQRLYYRWSAGSIFTGPGCRPCFDPVPQARAFPQPLVTA
jgi:Ca2+-binding RTX toxin-like protein